MKEKRSPCPWACLAPSLRQMTSSEFLLCMEKTMTTLPKCMKNLIPTENIQEVRYINTFQTHPVSKQGQTFEMVFCAEVCGISWIRRAIKQYIFQSKELKCSISGSINLCLWPHFLVPSAGKQCRRGASYITFVWVVNCHHHYGCYPQCTSKLLETN